MTARQVACLGQVRHRRYRHFRRRHWTKWDAAEDSVLRQAIAAQDAGAQRAGRPRQNAVPITPKRLQALMPWRSAKAIGARMARLRKADDAAGA